MCLDVVGYVDMFLGECPPMHKHGIIVTSSLEEVVDLWKSKDTLPSCLCRELLHNKGVSVGWKASTTWLWLLEMLLCETWMCNTGCCCKEEDLNEKNFLHNIVKSPSKKLLAPFFFCQFCDLAKMGKIHRKIQPKWVK
jgi:hypothetical protein